MMPTRAPRWTLDELGAQVALALAVDYAGPADGRVRDLPDRRTIRYYTTLGLLDRPAELRGRTALYGRRHLLQLVAIKKLQARGLSLAEVQRALVGQPDAALEAQAGLQPAPEPERRARIRGAGDRTGTPAAGGAGGEGSGRRPAGAGDGSQAIRQHLRCAPGGHLHLAPARPRRGRPVPHGGGRPCDRGAARG